MCGVNKVILLGNATRDTELRHTSSGKPVASIRLATDRQVAGKEVSQDHSIICWDTLAQTTSQYVLSLESTEGRRLSAYPLASFVPRVPASPGG